MKMQMMHLKRLEKLVKNVEKPQRILMVQCEESDENILWDKDGREYTRAEVEQMRADDPGLFVVQVILDRSIVDISHK